MISATAGIPKKPAFFITAAGQQMNESMLSKRIDTIGKRLNPDMPGNLRGSRLRKGIVTMQRADKTSTISDKRLAKQMSHAVSTAQKYYNIEDDAQSDVDVATYLSLLFKAKTADPPPSSEAPLTFVGGDDVEVCSGKNLPPPAQDILPLPTQHLVSPHDLKTLDSAPAPTTARASQPAKQTRPSDVGNITVSQKCLSWIQTGKIHDRASTSSTSTFSGGSRHYWTTLQGEALYKATMQLPLNAKIEEIYRAVSADEDYQAHGITQLFTRQQIRDKFRNVAKKNR